MLGRESPIAAFWQQRRQNFPVPFLVTAVLGVPLGAPVAWQLYQRLWPLMPEPCFLVVAILAGLLAVYARIAQTRKSGVFLQLQMGLISGICLGSNMGLLQIFATGSIFSLVMILIGFPLEIGLILWLLNGFANNVDNQGQYEPVVEDAHVIEMANPMEQLI